VAHRFRPFSAATTAVLILGIVLAGCDSGSSSSSSPSTTPAGACGEPVYAAVQGSGDDGAVVLAEHGTTKAAAPGGRSGQPSFSPDGTQLAYGLAPAGTTTAGEFALAVSDVGSTDARTLAAPEASGPAWAPDGKSIAYVRNVPDSAAGEIREVDVAAGTDDRAGARMAGDLRLASPTWSPDGVSVYYLASSGDLSEKGQIQAWAAQPLSGSFEEITVVDDSVNRMALAPDGRTALLTGTTGDVWTLDVKNGNLHAIDGFAVLADWIDDTHVVGYVRQGSGYGLATFTLKGKTLERTGTVKGFSSAGIRPWYGVTARPCTAA
jgi:Tol biopolymer transport system component